MGLDKEKSFCYFARVTENFSKDFPNQIQIQSIPFPGEGEDVNDDKGKIWVPYMCDVVGTGDSKDAGYGMHVLPEKDSIVVVLAMENGDASSAQHIVLGTFWDQSLLKPSFKKEIKVDGSENFKITEVANPDKPDNYAESFFLKSKQGTTILFDEAGKNFSIFNEGSGFVFLVDENLNVTLKVPGKLTIDASDMLIETKNGIQVKTKEDTKVTVGGKASFSSKQDFKIISGNNVLINGQNIKLNDGDNEEAKDVPDFKFDPNDKPNPPTDTDKIVNQVINKLGSPGLTHPVTLQYLGTDANYKEMKVEVKHESEFSVKASEFPLVCKKDGNGDIVEIYEPEGYPEVKSDKGVKIKEGVNALKKVVQPLEVKILYKKLRRMRIFSSHIEGKDWEKGKSLLCQSFVSDDATISCKVSPSDKLTFVKDDVDIVAKLEKDCLFEKRDIDEFGCIIPAIKFPSNTDGKYGDKNVVGKKAGDIKDDLDFYVAYKYDDHIKVKVKYIDDSLDENKWKDMEFYSAYSTKLSDFGEIVAKKFKALGKDLVEFVCQDKEYKLVSEVPANDLKDRNTVDKLGKYLGSVRLEAVYDNGALLLSKESAKQGFWTGNKGEDFINRNGVNIADPLDGNLTIRDVVDEVQESSKKHVDEIILYVAYNAKHLIPVYFIVPKEDDHGHIHYPLEEMQKNSDTFDNSEQAGLGEEHDVVTLDNGTYVWDLKKLDVVMDNFDLIDNFSVDSRAWEMCEGVSVQFVASKDEIIHPVYSSSDGHNIVDCVLNNEKCAFYRFTHKWVPWFGDRNCNIVNISETGNSYYGKFDNEGYKKLIRTVKFGFGNSGKNADVNANIYSSIVIGPNKQGEVFASDEYASGTGDGRKYIPYLLFANYTKTFVGSSLRTSYDQSFSDTFTTMTSFGQQQPAGGNGAGGGGAN